MVQESSSITLGGILALFIFTIVVMGILGPIAVATAVFNPSINASTPAAQYIHQLYGTGGVESYLNTSVNTNILPYANQSTQGTFQGLGSLQLTSGFAFIYGGLEEFFKAMYNFPYFLYVIFIMTFSYNGLAKLLPFDIAGLLSIVLLSYLSIILIMKLVSIFSKPSASVENL